MRRHWRVWAYFCLEVQLFVILLWKLFLEGERAWLEGSEIEVASGS
jgi:hypothetical protein